MRRRYAAWLVFLGAATGGCLTDMEYDWYRGSGGDRGGVGFEPPDVADGGAAPSRFAPSFGPTVLQDDPPPPLSGGTLEVIGRREAIAADPDRDLVYIVDHVDREVRATIALRPHDEPGRIAIDAEGQRAFVALRRGGAVVAIDLVERKIAARIEVCPMPRGIAWDAKTSSVIVVCTGGEIVTIESSFRSKTSRNVGLSDLRDVVVTSKGVVVSTFRTAELARLDGSGSPAHVRLPALPGSTRRVAWRMIAAPPPPGGDEPEVVVVSQESGDTVVDRPAEYYASSPGIGPGAVVNIGGADIAIPPAVLPVDVALSVDEIAVVAAGNSRSPALPQVFLARRGTGPRSFGGVGFGDGAQITSVAFTFDGTLLVLSREPARLYALPLGAGSPIAITLSNVSREDTGHAIFHANSGRGLACASCHPEGRDDGNAWRSLELGPRRTPSLIGTVAGTAPYHWNGEAKDMQAIADLSFVARMQGPLLHNDQLGALDHWLVALPPLVASPAGDSSVVARGKALFESERGKCATCHSGPARTNNATVDVGTGGRFQVPSLVNAGFRAPYLHDGTVGSIDELVAHGHGGNALTPSESADVSAYVRTF